MNNPEPLIKLVDNKLIISTSAISYLSINPGERVTINYLQQYNRSYPLIGRSEVFSDPYTGSKLTKSQTISFRGIQNKLLAQYGTYFTLKKSPINGAFYLVPLEFNN